MKQAIIELTAAVRELAAAIKEGKEETPPTPPIRRKPKKPTTTTTTRARARVLSPESGACFAAEGEAYFACMFWWAIFDTRKKVKKVVSPAKIKGAVHVAAPLFAPENVRKVWFW